MIRVGSPVETRGGAIAGWPPMPGPHRQPGDGDTGGADDGPGIRPTPLDNWSTLWAGWARKTVGSGRNTGTRQRVGVRSTTGPRVPGTGDQGPAVGRGLTVG